MRAIVNKLLNYGMLDGVITPNNLVLAAIGRHLKKGTAKLIVDSEETLMYILYDDTEEI